MRGELGLDVGGVTASPSSSRAKSSTTPGAKNQSSGSSSIVCAGSPAIVEL